MKFFVLVTGIIVLGICRQTVKPQDTSYLDQLNQKANLNKDGHVSFDELTEGIKKGIGLVDEGEKEGQMNQYYKNYIKNKKDKEQYFTEDDFQNILKQKSQKFKTWAKKTGDTISDKMGQAKEKIKETFQDIKDSASQKFSSAKETASDVITSATEKASDLSDDAEESIQQLKDKANKIYDKYDKNKKQTLSYQNLKEAIKNGVGEGKFFSKQQEKQFADRINKLYEKYIKDNTKKKPISRDAFFKIYSDESRVWKEKNLVQKTKQKASQLYDSFDLNKDGHVTLEEIGAGIKAGLGIGKGSQELKDQQSIKRYASDLYDKYIKPKERNRKWFTVDDFSAMLSEPSSQDLDCERMGKLSLQQLKLKARMNKNGEITIDEKKSESSKEESNGVFQYIRDLYEKYVGPGKQKKEFSEDDFNKIIEKWKEQCAYKKKQKAKAQEL